VNAREERRVMEGSSFKNRDECDTPHREWLPIRSPAARLIPVPESPRGGIVDPGSEQAVGRRLLPECGSLPHVGPVREAGCPPLALGMRNASALRQALCRSPNEIDRILNRPRVPVAIRKRRSSFGSFPSRRIRRSNAALSLRSHTARRPSSLPARLGFRPCRAAGSTSATFPSPRSGRSGR